MIDSTRLSFKIDQLSGNGLASYHSAVLAQDEDRLVEATEYLRAAIGFANSPFLYQYTDLLKTVAFIEDNLRLMEEAGLSPTPDVLTAMDENVWQIEHNTSVYEQGIYEKFLVEYARLQTDDYRTSVRVRILLAGLLTALVAFGVIALFMRAEQVQHNKRVEAEYASKAKSAFLANMSHEIRTPMNGIVGMMELLEKTTELNDDQRRMISVIRDSSFFLMSIIDDILDASKIEAGKLEIEKTGFALVEAVEKTAESLTLQARKNNVLFLIYVDAEVPDWVEGDPLRLRQILLNLLSNAIKFSNWGETEDKQGFVQLWVDRGRDGKSIRFRVIDRGIGMSEETIRTVFRPFQQAEQSTTRRFGGTGLGLVITRNLIDLMGGTLEVQSKLGEGSTFTVTLPLEEKGGETGLPKIDGVNLVIQMDKPVYNARMAKYYELRGAKVAMPASREDLLEAAAAADDDTVLLLALETLEENLALVDQIVERNPECNLLIMDPTRDNPKGLVKPRLYVSYRFPMQLTDTMRGIAMLTGRCVNDPQERARQFDALPLDAVKTVYDPVLVVEDNPLNMAVLTRQLELLGIEFETAENGAEGFEKWQANGFGMVLTDCQMPVMDGLEMTRKIREVEASRGGPQTAIIAISASALKEEAERSFEAGVSDYLTKPVQAAVLKQAIEKWSRRRDAEQSAEA
ncbi:ATP-binding protein [Thalassovita mangrovi]|nr:ATP-binding protein [Thalassovita mangrovi]